MERKRNERRKRNVQRQTKRIQVKGMFMSKGKERKDTKGKGKGQLMRGMKGKEKGQGCFCVVTQTTGIGMSERR